MKRKILAFVIIAMVAAAAFAFSGCAKQMLYGSWKLVQTGDPETGEYTDYDFMFPVVLEIKSDGTIEMFDSLFGTYEKIGNEYKFWYDEEGQKGEMMTGGWELIGSNLYVYPDEEAVIYKLSRLVEPTAEPEAQ